MCRVTLSPPLQHAGCADRGDISDDGGGRKDPTARYSDQNLLDIDEERGGGIVFDVLEEGSTNSPEAATSD